ncbi:acyl carrier protein [Saccharothrix ecbatanensis]|uniref:Acyl carrier protein n=1 Tax=Saccharothrix ecbatanensis TaxID=1105145 RepID=A0A7W9M1B0_9PSEU|nr:acyl carrier protein [Saccharothrix ecbatanensis]MBB5803789.1 acyl carrier protein [Saccharothrix ecbatanensis]
MADDKRLAEDAEDLRELIADILELPVAEVTDDAHFIDELEVDSLSAMHIVINLEKRYGIKVTDEEFKAVDSFADVRELVAAKRGAGS